MRQIKFRGKTVNGNEWIFGTTISQGTIKRKADKWFMEVGENKWKGLQPGSLGQFTGLFDKNGKEIYEGDIYRYDNPDSINEVSYCVGGGFAGFDLTPAIHSENRLLDVEIIGNIHDNPELLKQNKL